jgi:hypothetical protein
MTTTLQGIMRGSRNAVFSAEEHGLIHRNYVTSYVITSDDGTDDEGDVYETSGLPAWSSGFVGDNGRTDSGAIVNRRRIVDHDETRKLWIVEVEWDSATDQQTGSNSGGSDSPQDWSPEIEWDSESFTVNPTKDHAGTVLLTPAGDPYTDPPIEKTVHIPTLRYSRWELGFSASTQILYSGKTNLDVFLGFGVREALMGGIKARSEFIGGVQFWWVTYPIKFNVKTWDAEVFDRGENYLVGGVKTSAVTSEHATRVVDMNLDGTYSSTPKPRTKIIYEGAAFNPLLGT